MVKSVYKLQEPVAAMTFDLLGLMEHIPPGAVVQVQSECSQSGLVHLRWGERVYVTCRDTLNTRAERQKRY